MNSCLEVGEPMARCGLEGSPENLERIDAGANGSLRRRDIYAGGPSSGVKNLLLSSPIATRSCG